MNQYYFVDSNNNRRGPFPISSLRENGVNAYTYVWTEGMADWTRAADVPELAHIFVSHDSPLYKYHTAPGVSVPPDSKPDTPYTRALPRTVAAVWLTIFAMLLPWATLLVVFPMTGETIVFNYLSPFGKMPLWTILTPVIYALTVFMGVVSVTQSAMSDTLVVSDRKEQADSNSAFTVIFMIITALGGLASSAMMLLPMFFNF